MFRYALRTLAKNPAWTLAAVACLAIGIGANTTVYTAMRAIAIEPVPTPNSDRLVIMSEVKPREPDDPDFDQLAPANLVDWMRQTRTLAPAASTRDHAGPPVIPMQPHPLSTTIPQPTA